MPRFFIPSEQVRDGHAEILGADAVHLARSLRVHSGEVVVVIVADEHIEHGLENAYPAFMKLFSGGNHGKLVLQIA